jgi:hypothetical protein
MEGAAFGELVADIKAKRSGEPITMRDGMILDGRYCYGARQRHLAFGTNP